MATALAPAEERHIARPLKVLVPLIKDDLQHGKEAAERAGMPYYQAAGEKLIEAKDQLEHGEFAPWVKRNFELSERTARDYMKLAEATRKNGSALPFSTLSAFTQPDRDPSHRPAWHPQVQRVISNVDTETLNLRREDLKRQEERNAQKELALQLIDIGYKVLAAKLHPDKGGSREAMARLNAVRKRLQECV